MATPLGRTGRNRVRLERAISIRQRGERPCQSLPSAALDAVGVSRSSGSRRATSEASRPPHIAGVSRTARLGRVPVERSRSLVKFGPDLEMRIELQDRDTIVRSESVQKIPLFRASASSRRCAMARVLLKQKNDQASRAHRAGASRPASTPGRRVELRVAPTHPCRRLDAHGLPSIFTLKSSAVRRNGLTTIVEYPRVDDDRATSTRSPNRAAPGPRCRRPTSVRSPQRRANRSLAQSATWAREARVHAITLCGAATTVAQRQRRVRVDPLVALGSA